MLQKVNASLKKNNKGFTLVELIIVIAIIAVLAAVVAPQYIKYLDKSKAAVDENAMAELAHSVEVAIADTTVYDTLPSGNFSVAYTDNATDIVVTGVTDASALKTAVKSVVTIPIDFKSKTHEGQKATISVTYDTTNKTFKVAAPTFGAAS